jgi:hypothetical protein
LPGVGRGEANGRLILYNLHARKKASHIPLTLPDLVVMDFKATQKRSTLIISKCASARQTQEQGLLAQQLYICKSTVDYHLIANKPK